MLSNKFLSNVGVGTRLNVTVYAPLLALILVVASAVVIFDEINSGVDSIYKDRVVPLKDLKLIADDYAVKVIDAVNKANAGIMTAEQATDDLRQAQQRIRQLWQGYLATSLTEDEERLATEAESLFVQADRAIASVSDALQSMSGSVKGELDSFDGPLYAQIDPISDKIGELIALQLDVAGDVRDSINSETRSLTTTYIGGTILAIVLILSLSYLVRKSILDPLMQLRSSMEKIETTSDMTIVVNIESGDEIGQTVSAFNRMMRRLDSILAQVKRVALQLSAASEQLAVNSGQTNERLQQQQLETDQVATATNQMTATVSELAKSTSDAQHAAQQSEQLSSEGRRLADHNNQLTKELQEQLQQSVARAHKLEDESNNIGTVVNVINSIAEQTNLLALNAAIEAARAGEQGRGFAVVADEVRTLAQRTQESTQEIRDVVELLQIGARESVAAMNSGQEKAQECSDAIERGRESLMQIQEAVQKILDLNTHIATALEEQSSVTEEINRNVTVISEISAESASAGSEIYDASGHLSELASALQSQVNEFKLSE